MPKKERPVLANLVNSKTTAIEKFQNEVIRPIIKMQHQLLVQLFINYLKNRKVDFDFYSIDKKVSKIQSILKTDLMFKTLVLGCIIGQFSVDELKYYLAKAPEFNKRINRMIMQRLMNSVSEI